MHNHRELRVVDSISDEELPALCDSALACQYLWGADTEAIRMRLYRYVKIVKLHSQREIDGARFSHRFHRDELIRFARGSAAPEG